MTAHQSALTRLLDWAAGQIAALRASHKNLHTGEIYDEEIREEVEQVEADIAALTETCEFCGAETDPNGDRMDAGSHDLECPNRDADDGPRHGGDFVGTGGPLPGEPGNPNPSFEQMEANPSHRDVLGWLDTLTVIAMTSTETGATEKEIRMMSAGVRRALRTKSGVLKELLSERDCIEQALNFVDARVLPRVCDNEAVSACWRCQTIYLASVLRRAIVRTEEVGADDDIEDRDRLITFAAGLHRQIQGDVGRPADEAWRALPEHLQEAIEQGAAQDWNAEQDGTDERGPDGEGG